MSYLTAGPTPPMAACFLCEARAGQDDRSHLVLVRRARAFLMLNAYPYASGHLMAVINSHVGAVERVAAAELLEAVELVQAATAALRAEYGADGFNIGLNQGRAAGAGAPDHVHVHVVPRWQGDLNFMPVLGEVRVLPETLEQTWERLRGRFDA
jgi:ATP adenylyltransferase